MNRVNDCKCHGCEKRYIGCHSNCEDYKEFQKRRNNELKARREYGQARRSGWRYERTKKK